MTPPVPLLATLAQQVREAHHILFITGAGISADSGLPTYRGVGGLYEEADTAEGYAIEDALSGEMLETRPALTWKYLAQIEANCRQARPNRAHQAMAALESPTRHITVLTQNIDGLHRDGGSSDLIEIHGCLREIYCPRCGHEEQRRDYRDLPLPPPCLDCGAWLRPRVVLFGEALPQDAIRRLVGALEAGPDLVFSIGTTSVFPYIAEPVLWARQQGIPTVEINPGQTQVSALVSHRWKAGAANAMASLLEAVARAEGKR